MPMLRDSTASAISLTPQQALQVLAAADLICDAQTVDASIKRLAREISAALRDEHPLVLVVMRGGVFLAGQILPLLQFPLEVDYVHATRYGNETSGGRLLWKAEPPENTRGRVVLVLDDILDGGETLAAIKERILRSGASTCYCAVLTDKDIGRGKPVRPEFVGLKLPNRYVFGCGMDVSGAWRNLPAIYAVRDA